MATQVVTQNGQFNIGCTEVITTGLLTPLNLPAALSQALNYSNATTGALTIDQIHSKVYTLAAAPTTINLLSLLDLAGGATVFARIRDMVFYNADPVAAHVVTLYVPVSNGWAYLPTTPAVVTIPANGGLFWLHDPNSSLSTNGMVTSSTSRQVTMDPGANTVNLSVYIVGGSAT